MIVIRHDRPSALAAARSRREATASLWLASGLSRHRNARNRILGRSLGRADDKEQLHLIDSIGLVPVAAGQCSDEHMGRRAKRRPVVLTSD